MKKKYFIIVGFLSILLIGCQKENAKNSSKGMSEKEKASYALGVDIGRTFIDQIGLKNKDLDLNQFFEGVKTFVNGDSLKISSDSLAPIIQSYIGNIQKQVQDSLVKVNDSLGKINVVKSQEFLEKNKVKEGIITTSSGLQYEVIQKGEGGKPKRDDVVMVKYEGKTIDGNIFDSTEKHNQGKPIEIPLDKVIKGWTEGIQLMDKGAKYRFYIPSDLAYGKEAPSIIGPNQVLIFDVELVNFYSPKSKNIKGFE